MTTALISDLNAIITCSSISKSPSTDGEIGNRCTFVNCNQIGKYYHQNKPSAKYCWDHRQTNMTYPSKYCDEQNCINRAEYNYENMRPLLCVEHKQPSMIYARSGKCGEPSCNRQPNYNYPDKTRGIYCAKHKHSNMVDVKLPKCQYPDCTQQPNYNYVDQKKAILCANHKLPNMVDVKMPKCHEPGCVKQPNYNYPHLTKGIYCVQHKQPTMIDVKQPKCIYENCLTIPNYGEPNTTKPLYCNLHRQPHMVDVRNKKCQTSTCDRIVSNKYRGYCVNCYCKVYPDNPIVRNYKTKEIEVVMWIINNYPDYNWIADRKIAKGTSRRRPDLLLDLGSYVIIVEIDENQHKAYGNSDSKLLDIESNRVRELSKDLECPMVMIRFNPDKYQIDKNIFRGCWTTTPEGKCILDTNLINEWNQRLEHLGNTINGWLNIDVDKQVFVDKPNKLITIQYLFFDKITPIYTTDLSDKYI